MAKNKAIVSYGYWDRNLVRNFTEISTLHIICNSNPRILNTLESPYPAVKKEIEVEAVLPDNES